MVCLLQLTLSIYRHAVRRPSRGSLAVRRYYTLKRNDDDEDDDDNVDK